jgi:DNA-binding FrmR family transcriptional regulator
MGRIEKAPTWILKYKDRIENGTITVEDILEEENKLRGVSIKISSVTRAINAMGCPITGLRREKEAEVKKTKAEAKGKKGTSVEKGEGRIESGPAWLQKYRDRIEKGTITVEGIMEEENELREAPLKLSTVTRAINTMGYPITGLRTGDKVKQEFEEEEKERVEEPVEKGGERNRADKGPTWLQKYLDRIGKGTITVEEILEEENKIRKVPIKISSVTRAINATGYPITGLRKGKEPETGGEEGLTGESPKKVEKGPSWLQKYRDRIENGTITVEEILEEENRFREVPMKMSSVTRAINAMGYPITNLRKGKKEKAEESETLKKTGMREIYSCCIDNISEETEKRFTSIKKSWESELGKSLNNDHFVNVLIALAKLVEHGKTLAAIKR